MRSGGALASLLRLFELTARTKCHYGNIQK